MQRCLVHQFNGNASIILLRPTALAFENKQTSIRMTIWTENVRGLLFCGITFQAGFFLAKFGLPVEGSLHLAKHQINAR